MSRPRERDLLVFGTGALGCAFAGTIAATGAEVALCGTWPAALQAMAAEGVMVEEGATRQRSRVSVHHLADALPRARLVLILVKSHRTAAVAGPALSACAPEGSVLTLQNGMGNLEVLQDAARSTGCGEPSLLAGTTTVGATLVEPGVVRLFRGETAIGGLATPASEAWVRLLAAAGHAVRLEASLERLLWRKLAVNCAINPLGALRRCPNGALLEDAGDRATMREAALEVEHVAAARGLDLGPDAADLPLAVAARAAANRCSMLQDVERGAPTEIEAMNGFVVREAARLGVAVPVNARLREAVLALAGAPREVEA